jgi:hypothetical protein
VSRGTGLPNWKPELWAALGCLLGSGPARLVTAGLGRLQAHGPGWEITRQVSGVRHVTVFCELRLKLNRNTCRSFNVGFTLCPNVAVFDDARNFGRCSTKNFQHRSEADVHKCRQNRVQATFFGCFFLNVTVPLSS